MKKKLLEGTQILIALLNLDPDDIEVILLLARIYEQGADLQSAKELYEKALKIDPGHPQITEALERIQKELTASDPQHIAKPEHAKKLSALKGLSKLKSGRSPGRIGCKKKFGLELARSVLFIGPADSSTNLRLLPPAQGLLDAGFIVKTVTKPEENLLNDFQTIVAANPITDPSLVEFIQKAKQKGHRIVVDLDRDFTQLPADDPQNILSRQGNPDIQKSLGEVIGLADCVTTTTKKNSRKSFFLQQQCTGDPIFMEQKQPILAKTRSISRWIYGRYF